MSQPKPAPATGASKERQTQSETTTEQVMAMTAEPEREHRWLQTLIGEWTYEAEVPAHAGRPAEKLTGTERVRALGEIWVLAEGAGEMQGMAATTLMTLGYDPATKRIVGTWVGSMMTHMWVYDGELDANGNVLTLNSEGPSMADDGTTAQYRDVIALESDGRRRLSASVKGADGAWQTFMTTIYRRTQPGA